MWRDIQYSFSVKQASQRSNCLTLMDNYNLVQGQEMEISGALFSRKENRENGCDALVEDPDGFTLQSLLHASRPQQETVHVDYAESNGCEMLSSTDTSQTTYGGSVCGSKGGLSITDSLLRLEEQVLPSTPSCSLNSSIRSGRSIGQMTPPIRSLSSPELMTRECESLDVQVPVRSDRCYCFNSSNTQQSAIPTSPILLSHSESLSTLSSQPMVAAANSLSSHSIATSAEAKHSGTHLYTVSETDCAANGRDWAQGADQCLVLNDDVQQRFTCIPLDDHKAHLQMNEQHAASNIIRSPDYLEYCSNPGPKGMTLVSMTSLSSLSNDGPMCRICHEGDLSGEDLLAPCRCAGTLNYQHRKCLEQWLQTRGTDVCELCNYHFTTKRKARPFSEWIRQPTRIRDRRNILTDCGCFSLLTPLVCVSTWLCLNGAHHYLNYYQGRGLEGIGLVALASVLIIIYLFWSLMSLRYHCTIWRTWREEHQRVHVVMATSELQRAEPRSNSKLLPNRTETSPKSGGSCSLHSISIQDSPVQATTV